MGFSKNIYLLTRFIGEKYDGYFVGWFLIYKSLWFIRYQSMIYIYIYTNFVEHNRHFLSTYFLVDPFLLPYWFYNIRQELIDVFSIIVYIPSTFCPTLGHHQRRIYYKSDVTFVCTLLLCKTKSVWAVAVCSVYF